MGTFGNVSVVISNHFIEEGLGLISGGNTHAGRLHDIDNRDALIVQLTLDFLLVANEGILELRVLRVLLNGRDGPDGSSF